MGVACIAQRGVGQAARRAWRIGRGGTSRPFHGRRCGVAMPSSHVIGLHSAEFAISAIASATESTFAAARRERMRFAWYERHASGLERTVDLLGAVEEDSACLTVRLTGDTLLDGECLTGSCLTGSCLTASGSTRWICSVSDSVTGRRTAGLGGSDLSTKRSIIR